VYSFRGGVHSCGCGATADDPPHALQPPSAAAQRWAALHVYCMCTAYAGLLLAVKPDARRCRYAPSKSPHRLAAAKTHPPFSIVADARQLPCDDEEEPAPPFTLVITCGRMGGAHERVGARATWRSANTTTKSSAAAKRSGARVPEWHCTHKTPLQLHALFLYSQPLFNTTSASILNLLGRLRWENTDLSHFRLLRRCCYSGLELRNTVNAHDMLCAARGAG